jgi:hypothetical protein
VNGCAIFAKQQSRGIADLDALHVGKPSERISSSPSTVSRTRPTADSTSGTAISDLQFLSSQPLINFNQQLSVSNRHYRFNRDADLIEDRLAPFLVPEKTHMCTGQSTSISLFVRRFVLLDPLIDKYKSRSAVDQTSVLSASCGLCLCEPRKRVSNSQRFAWTSRI